MKKTYNKLTCLFGHHDYSDKETKDKHRNFVHLCKICGRNGYMKWEDGSETWYDYDEEGNRVHLRWSGGSEAWFDYDEEGNCLHEKWSDGTERCHTGRGYRGMGYDTQ